LVLYQEVINLINHDGMNVKKGAYLLTIRADNPIEIHTKRIILLR